MCARLTLLIGLGLLVSSLMPRSATGQIYRSYRYQPSLPQATFIDARTIPNPPLPPARVTFGNDGAREIEVRVADLKDPSRTKSMRIRPGAAVTLNLVRDAGERRISRYQVITPLGEWVTRQFVTDVPPDDRYEVIVHQWAVQSVAIDRTGKSPNTIEDINFQGRGIGRFRLPPGPQLRSGTIDVVRAAVSQRNEGSVPPIRSDDDGPTDTASALDRAIFEAQRAARQRRP